jgi:hypothetical protein
MLHVLVALVLASIAAVRAAPAQDPGSIRNPAGLQVLVETENAQPTLRIVLPGHPASDRAIEVLFPEHVTAVRHGATEGEHLYLFHPGRAGERPAWRRTGQSLEYERDLAGDIHFLARATLESDGVRFHYEFTNRSSVAYDMITAVTDPRLTSIFHDPRLERTWVHDSGGFALLAADTPERLTMPLERWLPNRYMASYTWPVPAQRVQRDADGITHYTRSRRVDLPFIATRSTDGAWTVASFTREVGNVWSNPELTCQHVDPQASLAPGGQAILEVKILVVRGSLDEALRAARRQRATLR